MEETSRSSCRTASTPCGTASTPCGTAGTSCGTACTPCGRASTTSTATSTFTPTGRRMRSFWAKRSQRATRSTTTTPSSQRRPTSTLSRESEDEKAMDEAIMAMDAAIMNGVRNGAGTAVATPFSRGARKIEFHPQPNRAQTTAGTSFSYDAQKQPYPDTAVSGRRRNMHRHHSHSTIPLAAENLLSRAVWECCRHCGQKMETKESYKKKTVKVTRRRRCHWRPS